jgi:F420H(2)-dependent quinone reductase
MNRRQPPGIWVTNHLANPLLRPLLHGPAGHRLGRHLALIRYRGRRTGRSHELPVQYARDGDRVWILPGAPGRKTWWRNLRGGAAVDLVLAGHDRHGHATVIAPSQPGFAEGLTAYLRAHPPARRALGLPRHSSPSHGDTGPRQVSDSTVLVRVDFDA